ncbi:MAG: rRNA maturation RNase YbeY [Erysipelotrichaceae bacterium]|nr:rRNA maturation RNase YbeY [Erysipelotrichaceae bacterium]
MALNVYNQTSERGFSKYRSYFSRIFRNAKKHVDLKRGTVVSVIFVNDEQIHQINRDYRNVDRPTDVISFALRDDDSEGDYVEEELGDIFINIDAARRQAVDYGHSLKREICFLFTHGLLHLCGYDHMTKEDEAEMIALQKKILDELVSQDDKED